MLKDSDPNNVTNGHSSRRARSSRVKPLPVKRIVAPVEAVKPDPVAWAYALKMAKDPRRLQAQRDGSVIIHNHPIR